MAILINDTAPRAQYTATSGQTVFAVPFEFFENADLKVYVGSALQASGYTVTGAGVTGGGSITFASGRTAGDVVTVTRDVPVKRVTDFPTSGPFNVDALNTDLDRLTAMVQQQETLDTRSLRIDSFDAPSTLNPLPVQAARKGRVLAFNATTGQPEAGPTLAAVQSVADASADIDAVAGSLASVGTVATNIANVNTVAGISSNVTTVAGSIANIDTVASDLNEAVSEINTVAVSIADVNAVGGVIGDVTTVAANITAIQNASANAATATTKASEASASASAASASASSALSSATAAASARDAALAALDSFDDRYLGSKSADPSLDNDGNALVAGALYYNSTSGIMKVYTGAGWVAAYVAGSDFLPISGGTLTGDLYLPTGGLVVGTTQLVAADDGNVGVGTAAPTNYGTGWRTLEVSGGKAAFRLAATSGSNVSGYMSTGASGDRIGFYTETNHPFLLGTNNVERFRLDATGEATFQSSVTAAGATFTGATAVDVNSATTALRITQIGTGNALVVEDDTSPDATPFVVTASGSVGIGTASPAAKLDVAGVINDSIGNVRNVPQNSQTGAYVLVATDNGKHISVTTGGVTVPSGVFAIGDTVTIYNNSASSQTITQGASVTLRQVGTANTGNRTLAQYGLATILCVASDTFVITGGGLS